MPRQPNPNRPPWSKALADARINAGLTQEEVSGKTSIPLTSIKKYETGERTPSFDTLYEIALAVGEPVYSLLDLDERDCESSNFRKFISPPYRNIIDCTNDDNIEFHTLSASGYSENYVEILNHETHQAKICKKTELVLEAAKIKNKLKRKYEAELKRCITEYIKETIKQK